MYDSDPFAVLGLRPGADADSVRAAYRRLVKGCHPDQFQDPAQQKAAQEKLIRLNLAYEAALKLSARHTVGFNLISQEEAKHFAQRLVEQGNLESALRQLNRADQKDADWYCLQGSILPHGREDGPRKPQIPRGRAGRRRRHEKEPARWRKGAGLDERPQTVTLPNE